MNESKTLADDILGEVTIQEVKVNSITSEVSIRIQMELTQEEYDYNMKQLYDAVKHVSIVPGDDEDADEVKCLEVDLIGECITYSFIIIK